MAENQQFDPKNVEWVDAAQTGQEAPTPIKPKRSATRTLGIVFGAVVLIGILIVFVVSIVNSFTRSNEGMTVEMRDDVQQAIDECRKMENPEECLGNIAQELAQENGNGEYCMELEGQPFIDCISLAAISSEDKSLCGRISDEGSSIVCNDAVVSLTLGTPEKESDCNQYRDQGRKDKCLASWEIVALRSPDCQALGLESALCEIGIITQDAINLQDPDICDQISDEFYARDCRESTEPGDRDFDGLDESEEASHGTDDRNADTDGDGFSDFEEIQNGFDPLS